MKHPGTLGAAHRREGEAAPVRAYPKAWRSIHEIAIEVCLIQHYYGWLRESRKTAGSPFEPADWSTPGEGALRGKVGKMVDSRTHDSSKCLVYHR